jgi:hypothetical protein
VPFFISGLPLNHPHPQGGDRISALEQRMSTIEQQVSDWRTELSANTEATLRVESNTNELVELLKLAKGGIGFFTATGRVMRKLVVWFGPFIAFAAAVWALMHGKFPGQS